MAEFADSERTLWRQAEMLRRLRVQVLDQQRVIAILARRQAGVLVIEPEEMLAVPPGFVLVRGERPDGAMVLRVEDGSGGQRPEPGSEG